MAETRSSFAMKPYKFNVLHLISETKSASMQSDTLSLTNTRTFDTQTHTTTGHTEHVRRTQTHVCRTEPKSEKKKFTHPNDECLSVLIFLFSSAFANYSKCKIFDRRTKNQTNENKNETEKKRFSKKIGFCCFVWNLLFPI